MEMYTYQSEGVDWMVERELDDNIKGGVLADEVGLGKTLMTIHTILQNPKKNTLILVPKSLVYQWRDEIIKFTTPEQITFHIFEKKTLFNTIPGKVSVCIASHSVINSRMYQDRDLNMCQLFRKKWDRIVIDEGHVIKNSKSKMSKRVFLLKSDIKWVLTATPLMNKLNDFINILKWVGVNRDCSTTYTKNINEKYVKRRTKEDINMKLPELTVDVCRIPLDKESEEWEVYKEAYELARRELKIAKYEEGNEMICALRMLMHMRQVCTYPQLFYDSVAKKEETDPKIYTGKCSKIQLLCQKIKAQSHDDKSLVFCEFKKEMTHIQEQLTNLGIETLMLTGSMTNLERANEVHSFNTDINKKVFIIQRSIGGVGYNFQIANHVYIMSPTWNPSLQLQIIGRAHRTGQQKPVNVTLFAIGENNESRLFIEEWMMSLQDKKRNLIAKILNDERIKTQETGGAYLRANKIANNISFRVIYNIFMKKLT
tara:strand:+ start:87 stop:1538 length:1452 start_codon:yes stop_codon:yes gene_type:complete